MYLGTLAALVLLLLFGSAWSEFIAGLKSPWVYGNDLLQQIHPLFRLEDRTLFPGDYIVDYYLRAIIPAGVQGVYWLGAVTVGIDCWWRILTVAVLLLTITGIGAAASLMSGLGGALASMVLASSSELIYLRTYGGLPRGYGFPLLAWTAYALLRRDLRLLGALTILGAALYPAAMIIAAGCYAVEFLRVARSRAISGKLWRGTIGVVCGAFLFLAPQLVGSQEYGARISGLEEIPVAEAGPGGRYGRVDRLPHRSILEILGEYGSKALLEYRVEAGRQLPQENLVRGFWWGTGALVLLAATAAFVAFARAGRVRCDVPLQQLGLFGVVVLCAYGVARVLYPLLYFPERYLLYGWPTLLLISFPALLTFSGAWCGLSQRLARAFPLLLVLLLVALGGIRLSPLDLPHAENAAPLLRYLTTLPNDSRIAGWPSGVIDTVPFFTRRSVLVHFETHQAFHQGYLLEMRKRARVLFAAYFGTERKALQRLRDEYRVTHLVVERAYLEGDRPPTYFLPFAPLLPPLWQKGKREGFAVLQVEREAISYDDGRWFAIELSKVG